MIRWARDIESFVLPALAVALLLVASSAPAQTASTNERALAEALFREARELMQAQRYAEACAKFQESQRLDPGGGTLLNLAVCHEAEGKTASSWAEFEEALAIARSDGRRDRVDLALEHIEALEPRLSKLTIEVADDAPNGLIVSINSMQVGSAGWGSEVPVDPGTVELRAEAPKYEPFLQSVEIAEGQKLTVDIPPLEPLPASASSTGPEPEPGADERTPSKTGAYVVGAVGIAALGVGSYFGVRAMQEKKKADNNDCDDSGCHSKAGHEADKRAVFNGWLSTAGFAAGLTALGVATYLYLDGDGADEEPPGAVGAVRGQPRYALVPVVEDSAAALWFSGTF